VPRGLVALFALLEAFRVVVLGLLGPFLFGILAWVSLSGFTTTPLGLWQLSVQVWALGHGVPLDVSLGGSSAILTGELASFSLSLAPFLFAIITAVLGRRAGRRLPESSEATFIIGVLVAGVAGFAALALVSARTETVDFDVVAGALRVVAPFVLGLVMGWRPWLDGRTSRNTVGSVLDRWRDEIGVASRIAGFTLAGAVAIAGATLAVLVLTGYATMVSLYESLHTGILGGFVLTAAQMAFIPVAVVWMVAWIVGPGFAIGSGAVVSPFATTVGAVPAIPLLGIIPESTVVGGWVTIIPGLIALIAAVRFSGWVSSRDRVFNPGSLADMGRLAFTAAAAAAIVGLTTAVVGSYASGSAGGGRFALVGIDPVFVALVLAGGVLAGSFIGLFAGKIVGDSTAKRTDGIVPTPPR
jgi:hypothetical protein